MDLKLKHELNNIKKRLLKLERDKPVALKIQYLPNYCQEWPELKKTEENSGFDMRAAIEKPIHIALGETKFVKLGVRVDIPTGYEVQVRPRSGLAGKQGITILNTPGTVDSGYKGEWQAIVHNANQKGDPFIIQPGDRICQGVLMKVPHVEFEEVDVVTSDSDRGEDGFGSSGVK